MKPEGASYLIRPYGHRLIEAPFCRTLVSVHITVLCMIASSFLVVWSYWSLFAALRRGEQQPIVTRVALCCASVLGLSSIVFGAHAWGDLAFGSINAVLSGTAVWLTWKSHETIQMSRIDCVCLVLSLAGTAIFACVHNPTTGAGFAIAADLVAFLPVIRAIHRNPETQPVRTYFIGCAAAAVALAGDKAQGPVGISSAFTIYLMIIDLALPTATLIMRAARKEYPKAPLQLMPEEALRKL